MSPIITANLTICLLLLLPLSRASKLDDLKNLRSRCFSDAKAGIMLSDHLGSFGCAQCIDDVRAASVIEFVTTEELSAWINKNPDRVVMMPEYLFFDASVLSTLVTATNIVALVVYDGDSPLLEGNLLPGETFPYPPLRQYSDDIQEPNVRSNFYFADGNSSTPGSENNIIQFAAERSVHRNPYGSGAKFSFFPFNVFRVSSATADYIRNESRRFTDDILFTGESSNVGKNDARTSPRYKLRSIGKMYACWSTPTPTPTREASTDEDAPTTPDINPVTLVTSERCLQDKTCQPVGGHSVWSSLDQLHNETTRILAISAPMDSVAFFSDLAYGASSEISSLAVLMAVAEAVSLFYHQNINISETALEVLPTYFVWNAESWGYAGSSRFLQDLNDLRHCTDNDGTECSQISEILKRSPKLPNLRDVMFEVLNIGQLIFPNWDNSLPGTVNLTYYLHASNFTCASRKLDEPSAQCEIIHSQIDPNEANFPIHLERAFLEDTLWSANISVSLKAPESMSEFPLDSTQSIFRHRPNNSTVYSLSSYTSEFNNSYFHSIYDNTTLITSGLSGNLSAGTVGHIPLYVVAQAITNAVISFVFPNVDTSQQVNASQIDEIIHCLTTTNWSSCQLGKMYSDPSVFEVDDKPIVGGNYVGSFFNWDRLITVNPSLALKIDFVKNFLAYHNRYDSVGLDELNTCEDISDCENYRKALQEESGISHTVYCIRQKCVVSDTYLHDAFGTGINATDAKRTAFTFKPMEDVSVSNPQKGAWTESVWDEDLSLCAFVEDTTLYSSLVFLAGILVFGFSFLLTYLFNRHIQKNMPLYEEEVISLTRPVEALP